MEQKSTGVTFPIEVTKRGIITIPLIIRKKLNIKPGDMVTFEILEVKPKDS